MCGDKEFCAIDYIDEIFEIIGVLEKKGYVYIIFDGLYFDIKSFLEYGKFLG